MYLSLHCHHQNDSCIKMGRDERSHFNVSLIIVRDNVVRQYPQTTTFEEIGEPTRIRTEVALLTSLTPYRMAKPAHLTSVGAGGTKTMQTYKDIYRPVTQSCIKLK